MAPTDGNGCRLGYYVVGGRRAIIVINREAVEIYNVLVSFIIQYQTLQRRPCLTPSAEAPGGTVCSSIKTMPLEGETAHHGGDICELCVSLAKSLPSGSFLFPPHLDVKL